MDYEPPEYIQGFLEKHRIDWRGKSEAEIDAILAELAKNGLYPEPLEYEKGANP